MSMIDQAREAQKSATANTTNQAVLRTEIDSARWEELAAKIEATYPGMRLNLDAITKGGKTATQKAVVLFSCKRRLPTPASVTMYHNGTVVWAGCDALTLDAPEPVKKTRKAKAEEAEPVTE